MRSLRRLCIVSGILLVSLWAFALPGHAQIESVTLKVDGLACPFCSYGLSKELKRVEGIKEANIFVDEGRVELEVEQGKPVDIEKLPEAVRKGGFTAREIKVTAVGRIEEWNGSPVLAVAPGDIKFLLEEDETLLRLRESLKAQGKNQLVTVSGQIKEENPMDHHGHPLILQIERFEVK